MSYDLPARDGLRVGARLLANASQPTQTLRGFFGRLATAILTISVVALSPLATHAQNSTGSVEGRVQNAVTGAAINNAIVSVKGTNTVQQTDEAGRYLLSELPAGPVTLRYTYGGLDEQEVTVTVTAGQTVTQDVNMTSKALYGDTGDAVRLNEFVVQSTRETNAQMIAINEQRAASNIMSVVSTDEFGTIVDRNPGEFLKMLPGVDVEYFANNIVGVSVRGLGSVNTEVNFDGMPVASANAEAAGRGFEIQYASAADVARVEVRKLPLPEDSSNALGGLINLVRKSAFEQSRRRINYRVLFQSDGEEFTLDRMDGPKDKLRNRWRPNWEVAWIEPVNKNFGFAVTVGQNDTLVNTHWSTFGWNLGSAAQNTIGQARRAAGETWDAAPSIYYPGLQNPLNHNAPKMQGKDYVSLRLDWRPVRTLTLGSSVSWVNGWVENADDIRYRWNGAQSGSGNAASFVGVDPSRGFTNYSTVGRPGGGGIYHDNPLWRDVKAPSISTVFDARWRSGRWTAGAKFSYSHGKYKYFDTENGFFNSTSVSDVAGLNNIPHTGVGAATANPIPLTVTFTGADNYWAPTGILAHTTASGAASTVPADYTTPVDWWRNSVVRIGGARSRPGRATDIVAAAKLFAKYDFGFTNPLSVQLGADLYERYRDRRYRSLAWRFVGADGIPMSADDSATHMAAVNLPARRDSVYDYPAIERISMSRLYDLYKTNPSWFQFDHERSARLDLTQNAAYRLTETNVAPYLQFDTRLLRNRLRLTGGVRYERADAEARGLLSNNSAAYMKYSDGTVVRSGDRIGGSAGTLTVQNLGTSTNVNYQIVAPGIPDFRSGTPVFLPSIQAAGNALRAAGLSTDTNLNVGRATMLHTQTIYRDLGARAESTHDNFFPSLHASYDLTPNWVLQSGYARTQARNRFDRTVIPNNDISDTPAGSLGAIGRISVRNPDLKPWTADNFEVRSTYYLGARSSIGVGVYRKNIQNYQIDDESHPLTPEDIAAGVARMQDGTLVTLNPDWNIGAEHVGYDVSVFYNKGTARLDGAELEFRQSLDGLLPDWGRGITLRGTSAYNNLKGRPGGGDLGGIRDWRHTFGLGYSRARFGLNVNYTMNGEQVNSIVTSNGFSAEQVTLAQHMVDFNVEYRFKPWLRLFFSGRNITDELRARENQYAQSPTFTWLNSSNTFGVTYAVGVTGEF